MDMRAIVLLCLVHAASAGDYAWPMHHNSPDSPDLCLRDDTSCGCCLMEKKMERLETFFNMVIREINKYLEKPKMALQEMIANRSAFSVAFNHSGSLSCFGPFDVIKYNKIFLNLGGGYDPTTGSFTAPHSGVYSLAITVYSASTTNSAACANLMVNNTMVAKVIEKKDHDNEDSATVVVSVRLNAGDKVWVHLPEECTICDDENHFNTFTGFLLYTDVKQSKMLPFWSV